MWLPLIVVAVNSFNQETLMAGWGGFTTTGTAGPARPERAHRPQTTMIHRASPRRCSRSCSPSPARSGGGGPRRRRGRSYDGLIYARIILPEVVFATALFFLFLKIHFTLGLTAIVIGHTVWNSAYAAIIVQARMAGARPRARGGRRRPGRDPVAHVPAGDVRGAAARRSSRPACSRSRSRSTTWSPPFPAGRVQHTAAGGDPAA